MVNIANTMFSHITYTCAKYTIMFKLQQNMMKAGNGRYNKGGLKLEQFYYHSMIVILTQHLLF
jgi:hypothetical protein